MDDEPWYVNAVLYGLDVSRFHDGDGDGIGDFEGLLARFDHLVSLGVTCLWLLPFYDSPRRDNGYTDLLLRHGSSNHKREWRRWELVETGAPDVLGIRCAHDVGEVLTLHELAGRPATATVTLPPHGHQRTRAVFGKGRLVRAGKGQLRAKLPAWGHAWFRLSSEERPESEALD